MYRQLRDLFSHDILNGLLSSWGDLTEHYRPLLYFMAVLWTLSFAFDVLRSTRTLGPQLISYLRGVLVILYLSSPFVPRAFLAFLQIPDSASHILLSAVVDDIPHASGDSAATLSSLMEAVNTKSVALLEQQSVFDFDFTVLFQISAIYILITTFVAIVVYIQALVTFFQASLLFLLPFAVALYPFSYTRPIFDGLIRQAISFSLVMPLLNVILVAVVGALDYYFQAYAQGSLQDLMPFFILGTLGCVLAFVTPQLASGIAGGIGLPIPKPRV